MINAQSATIYNELAEQLRHLLLNLCLYLDPNDLKVRQLKREAEKLIHANASLGYTMLASIAQLSGNATDLRYFAENAARLQQDSPWRGILAVGLQNLGYFSESQAEIVITSAPERGQFSSEFPIAVNSGAIQTTWQRYQSLPSMGIEMPHDFPKETIREAASVLQAEGVSDVNVASILDVAGSVLRNHNCFFAGLGPEISVRRLGGRAVVHFRFGLGLDPSEIADANTELALLMAQADTPILEAVHVSFGVAL